MKIVIIIPTYNERENIVSIIFSLLNVFEIIPHDMHILVVDDNSPDGTGDMVIREMKEHKNIHLLQGEKKGLGAAYVRGMRFAIDELNADAVFEMDADFSHDPQDVPRMLEPLYESYDFVIGSRYVAGGKIPEEWGWYRRLVSRYGNIVARYIAGLYSILDCTAGFRAIKVSILKEINLEKLKVRGYAFQVALLHQAVSIGAKIKEIPVEFIDRKYGESKLGIKDIIEFIINAWWIRLNSMEIFIKYGIVGFSGVLINLSIFFIFLNIGVNKYIASFFAIGISIIWNFIFNNYWIFKNRKAGFWSKIRRFKLNFFSIISLMLSSLTFITLCFLFQQNSLYLNQLLSIAPAIVVNYFFDTYWTFNDAVTN